MRVVAGDARGRTITAPRGRDTRPTADRVREAVFNALHSLGGVAEATVLDLFAGSGALGIEALSRGAAHATFVDRDRHALAAVRANLEATGLAGRATVRQADAMSFEGGAYDLALLDPPYAFEDAQWRRVLTNVDAELIVVESDRVVDLPARWRVLRSKRYGSTVVSIARQDGAPEEGPQSP
jgi:16S rRNA (guanine966-N2)-methyltransferase